MANYTFDDLVTLISQTVETNAAGDAIPTETRRESYAQVASVGGKETYEALAVGIKPELKIVLPSWEDDYHGERQVEYRGERYNVIRTYKAADLSAELTVSRLKAVVPDLGTMAAGV